MLVDKLLKDGKYRLVERSALDKILAEQNFSNSDRADSNTAAKIGKVLEWTPSSLDQSRNLGATTSTRISAEADTDLASFGLGGVGTSKAKAVVGNHGTGN